ncbi:MAG: hypothetical protein ACLQNE_31405 [Thermoguttaceae bacterium]
MSAAGTAFSGSNFHDPRGAGGNGYAVPFQPNPKAEPIKDAWAVRKETATGGPMALVSYPDFRPSPQMEVMGEVFAEIQPIAMDLLRLIFRFRPLDQSAEDHSSAFRPIAEGTLRDAR